MSTIGGDYSDFDRSDPAEIELRMQQREEANRLLRQKLPALASAFARSARRRDTVNMRATILAVEQLVQPPAYAPLVQQLCSIVLSELQSGIVLWRAHRLAKLLTAEAARLHRGEPFASKRLVAEARAYREGKRSRSWLAGSLLSLVSRAR